VGCVQVVELVKALLMHLKASENLEWVDITTVPKAAHLIQKKQDVACFPPRRGSRNVGPEEWQKLMAEIRNKYGKLAIFLAKYPEVFEIR
jgi:hypothetical protein